MNKIIQEIMVKVKREIENNIIKTLEGEINLDRMVDSVGEMVNNIGLDTLSAIVGEINKHIKEMPERKGKYYLQRKNDNRSLVTRFGLFEFQRDYYKNIKNNEYIYILDKLLGVKKYEKVEANLKGQILEKASEVSYAKAAKYSSPITISRQTVKNIVRENGAIGNLEHKIPSKKEVKTIYIEADEDHVALQNGKNKEMKLIYVYDNKKQENKTRIKLENIRYLTGNMKPEELWTEVASYIDEAYDLDKAENIYIAGDGANWIKTGLGIITKSKYVLDHYHLSKYIKIITAHLGGLENPVNIDKPLWKALRTNKKKQVIELIDFAIEETPSKSKIRRMKDAKRYILNNWEGIKNLYKENYSCSAEGHISHILSSRLSSRPMGWSQIGMDEMARLRTYKASGGNIRDYYRQERERVNKEEKIKKLDQRVIKGIKSKYAAIEPSIMTDMPLLSRREGRWLKDMLNFSVI